MNPRDEQAIIDQTQQNYISGDTYWAADLMVQLENDRQGKSLLWAIECVQAVVRTAIHDDLIENKKLLGYLADLSLQANADPNLQWLKERSLQIWYELRDIYHTAIAHLYDALAFLTEQNFSRYRGSVVAALYVIGDDKDVLRTRAEGMLAIYQLFHSGATK